QVTVQAWVKLTSLSNSQMGIAGTWDDVSGNNRSYLLYILNGKAQFYVSHTGSDFPNVTSATTLQVGVWYQLTGTFDGTNLRLYVNGNLEATTNSPGSIHTNTHPFYIGRADVGGGNRYFSGIIDEVRVWNVAHTQSAIQGDLSRTLTGTE